MSPLKLFNLPDIAVKEIFSYLSFDEVSRLRVVNHDFNQIGKEVLNKGLVRIEKFHNMCLKEVRLQLPRRESERRSHPLARHVDVLMAIETRISMLSMTYAKYIDSGLTCFIPGKVLDEMYRVLRLVRGSECPPRPHEILQELRDISSMAMEHFDDKIAPELKQKLSPSSAGGSLLLLKQGASRRHSFVLRPADAGGAGGPSLVLGSGSPQQQDEVEKLLDIEVSMKRAKLSSLLVSKELKALRTKVRHQGRHLVQQRSKVREHAAKIAEQATQLAELRRLMDEYGRELPVPISVPSSSVAPQPSTSKQPPRECKRKAASASAEAATASKGSAHKKRRKH